MSALTNDLKKLTEAAENTAAGEAGFRQKFHLMPPVGWLNDPTTVPDERRIPCILSVFPV